MMKDLEELAATASTDCLQHAREILTGEFTVQAVNQERFWGKPELRHLFSQTMNVCLRLNTIELIFDDAENLIGFVDSERWEQCEWRELDPALIVHLIRAENVAPHELRVRETRRGPDNCLEVICERVHGDATGRLVLVRINPARGVVISLEPIE